MSNPKVKHKADLAIAKEFVATMKRRGLSRGQTIALLDEADHSGEDRVIQSAKMSETHYYEWLRDDHARKAGE
jgi:ribosome-binding factor A